MMKSAALLATLAIVPASVGAQNLRTFEEPPLSLDPRTVEIKSDAPPSSGGGMNSRKFFRYVPSQWEQMWLRNVDAWADSQSICDVLLNEQSFMVHDFLKLTCGSYMPPPYDNWCVIDDAFHPLWYNTANRQFFELSWLRPADIPDDLEIPRPLPVMPTEADEHIVSKMIYLNEFTGDYYHEYIEPLVSHLRFPLTKCLDIEPARSDVADEYYYYATTFRGWIIPPAPGVMERSNGGKAYYFDAGASSWDQGAGGPSLSYFVNMWQRHGLVFDDIYAFEMTTPEQEFYETVPDEYHYTMHYKQCAVSSHPDEHSEENPFLPILIHEMTQPDDYVLFKLDIDSPAVEDGNIFFILDDEQNNIDEVVWEHHITGNYLMEEWRGPNGENPDLADLTLRQSYEFFLKMREKGIRAHSWI